MTRGSMSAKDASLPCAEAATVPLWSGAPAHPQVPLQDPAGRPEAQSSLATPLVQPKAMRALPGGRVLSLLGTATLNSGHLHRGQCLRSHGLDGERVVLHGGPYQG